MVQFRFIGPTEIRAGDTPHHPGPPQRRAVLAALACDAGDPVSVDTIIDRVWREPPDGARRAVYVHVTHLRGMLDRINNDRTDAIGAPPARLTRLTRRSGGYSLDVDRDAIDLHRFRRLIADAGAADLPDPARADLLWQALALWRGIPLSDVDGPWADVVRQRWQAMRLEALLSWAEAALRLGRPQSVLRHLHDAAVEYPMVEPLAALLMRALEATGRGTEAMRHFAGLRRRLIDELGAEPGADLRNLHQRILVRHADEEQARTRLGARPGERVEAVTAATPEHATVAELLLAPAQLPPAASTFTGRQSELARLDRLGWLDVMARLEAAAQLDGVAEVAGRPDRSVTVTVVSGPPGVGKTGLALYWAHQRAEHFPDGQLYVDLRGFDSHAPMMPEQALAIFLRGLGVPDGEIPPDLAGRSARYRSLVAGRRLLVVLDNSAGVDQVLPLLPGTGPSGVLVTSRDRHSGLVARHGAVRIDLDPLPATDALRLLRALMPERVAADPDAAALMVRTCAGLPLALRIVGEVAAGRPGQTLRDLASRLSNPNTRLDVFDTGGDPRACLREVFSWSYRQLSANAARVFRGFGVHAGTTVDTAIAGALLGLTQRDLRRGLVELAQGHLVTMLTPDRAAINELVRTYAVELADRRPPSGRPDPRTTTVRPRASIVDTVAANVR